VPPEGVAFRVTDWPLSIVGALGKTVAVNGGLTVNSMTDEYAVTWTGAPSVTAAQKYVWVVELGAGEDRMVEVPTTLAFVLTTVAPDGQVPLVPL
jgi:ribosomal 30S subunit maturation factor RimM